MTHQTLVRFWIERGHAHFLSFRMVPGDLLFIDYTTTTHDRDI
jgi:hypothetical protein